MAFKIVVNFVQRMVNKLWRLKMFINHPLNVINHICTALTIQFDVEIQFQICVSKHGVDHSISNLCVKISSLILIFLDIMLRAIHSISPYHSMILIPGLRPHQFMFLIALRLVKLWMPSFRYSFKIIFIECYIRKLQIYRFWFFNFFFLIWTANFCCWTCYW